MLLWAIGGVVYMILIHGLVGYAEHRIHRHTYDCQADFII